MDVVPVKPASDYRGPAPANEIAFEQNRLSNERALADIDDQVLRLNRLSERRETLAANGTGSIEQRDLMEDELSYYNRLKPIQAEIGHVKSRGGQWVFVIAGENKWANRRHIQMGRRTSQRIEILGGISIGDWDITSDFAGIARFDQLALVE